MKIHFISIGGAVMHNLAIALKKAGHEVTGSDDEIYDPARTRLDKVGLLPSNEGWFESNIHSDLDLIILGMHARQGNPELEKALALGIKVQSFPEFIYEQAEGKMRVVVGGSHGKTTTTSMIMHALKESGIDFDYLVGAYLDGFEDMVRISDAPLIVIEGDEYLSSALDRRPKFLHYHPQISILTGIAWDHMNVFPSEENYFSQFEQYLESLPDGAEVYYFNDDSQLSQLAKSHERNISMIPYGRVKYKTGVDGWSAIDSMGKSYPIGVFGSHNMANMEAARRVCMALGLSEEDFFKSMGGFEGAKKRLQLIAEKKGRFFYQDFAHAPSKVRATVKSFRERFPDGDLCAVVELHTFSSLNKSFLPQYKGALDDANTAVVFFSPHTLSMKKMPPLSTEDIKSNFGREDIEIIHQADELRRTLLERQTPSTHFLMMSSGTFGGTDLKYLADTLFSEF